MLRSTTPRCFFFGFKGRDSVTQILIQLRLRTFNAIIHNSIAVTHLSWTNSFKAIAVNLNYILCTFASI